MPGLTKDPTFGQVLSDWEKALRIKNNFLLPLQQQSMYVSRFSVWERESDQNAAWLLRSMFNRTK